MKEFASDLKKLRNNLERANQKVLMAQLDDFSRELYDRSPSDLEYAVRVRRVDDTTVAVEQEGNQVIYSEFGTGWIGEINPRHPQEGELMAPDPAWGFYSVNITKKDEYGWTYLDGGEPKWTAGVPAGMQNYLAFQYVARNTQRYADMWKREVE